MEPTNDQRADWAAKALDVFAKDTGMRSSTNWEDADLIVSDFLADLMHMCDRDDIDFSTAIARAESHYRDEAPLELRNNEEV